MVKKIWKPHVTVAAVAEKDGRFLIVEETVDQQLVLNQPAGHLDPGETLFDAVIRETFEETAHRFTPKGVVGVYRWTHVDRDRTYIRFAFYGDITGFEPNQPLDDGIERALWLSRDELGQHRERWRTAMVGQVFDDYLAGRRFPLELLNEVEY